MLNTKIALVPWKKLKLFHLGSYSKVETSKLQTIISKVNWPNETYLYSYAVSDRIYRSYVTSDNGILDRTELITEKSISATTIPVACRSGTQTESATMGFSTNSSLACFFGRILRILVRVFMNSPNPVLHLVSQMLKYSVEFWKLEFWEFYMPKMTFHGAGFMNSHHSNREFQNYWRIAAVIAVMNSRHREFPSEVPPNKRALKSSHCVYIFISKKTKEDSITHLVNVQMHMHSQNAYVYHGACML